MNYSIFAEKMSIIGKAQLPFQVVVVNLPNSIFMLLSRNISPNLDIEPDNLESWMRPPLRVI